MKIKDEHIKEAEILLINGNTFDSVERVPFIKDLNTCDLLAVPGSGKTTALLAKLYCISKQLPFKDGSGILILSHTNSSVEEIEKNLKSFCPGLFEYPNFIGTVQSFVNKFLANQACQIKYGSYIRQNDNELYNYEAINFFNSLKWSSTNQKSKNLINKLYGILNYGKTVNFQEGNEKILDFLKNFFFNVNDRKLIYNNRTILKFNSENQSYYRELENWKENLFKKGLLNYRDSFNLADWYLENYLEAKLLLQNRFKFIFIDETQDLESFQIEIIEKIFNSENSNTKIQRIGDINQSIYNSAKNIKIESDWVPRNQKFLTGSNRLTKEISELVDCFTLDIQKNEKEIPQMVVNGLRKLEKPIKPHLILFDKESTNKLEETFRKLIKKNNLDKTLESKKYGFKIIGWNAKWNNGENKGEKLRLEDIFFSYNHEAKSNKETFNTLSKYLQSFKRNKSTLEMARNAILNALITVLKLENKTYKTKIKGQEVDRYYTKSELIKTIQYHTNRNIYEIFKSQLYKWSFEIMVFEKNTEAYNSIKEFIKNEFKEWFNLEINNKVNFFLEERYNELKVSKLENEPLKKEEISIEIGTVHSVKGQTNCATMYVETSYFNYESEKLYVIAKKATKTKPEHSLNYPLFCEKHEYRPNKDSRAKETLKMMYVGFSRPTHLLCFALLKENLKDSMKRYEDSGWEIIDLTN